MDSSSTPKKDKKGINRLWSKVKLAIRPKPKSKQAPTVMEGTEMDTTQPESVQRSQPIESTTQPTQSTTPVATAMQSTGIPTTQIEADQSLGQSPTSPEKEELARRYERAQAIFKKYDIEFDEAGWELRPKPQSERVYKPARMRVRWTCHECKTTFGHDKVCVECAHQRCRTCARYPPKKRKSKATRKPAVPTSSEAADVVREGVCHECQTTFEMGKEECPNCHHTICERCLHEALATTEQAELRTVPVS